MSKWSNSVPIKLQISLSPLLTSQDNKFLDRHKPHPTRLLWEINSRIINILERNKLIISRTSDGFHFDGNSFLTIENINRYSLTLSVWLWMDSSFSTFHQEIFITLFSPLSLEIAPSNDIIHVNGNTQFQEAKMFGQMS